MTMREEKLIFSLITKQSTRSSNPEKNTFNKPDAKVIDTYSLLRNNCATTSIGGINVDEDLVESKSISPNGLVKDLNKLSDNSKNIIKVENPIDFINNILKLWKYE